MGAGEKAGEKAGKSAGVVVEGGCLGAALVEAVRLEVLGGRGEVLLGRSERWVKVALECPGEGEGDAAQSSF